METTGFGVISPSTVRFDLVIKLTSHTNLYYALEDIKNHPWPPVGALVNHQREEPFKSRFDDSINAISFGFVGTYILISMLLDTDIFEKLTRIS
ncbi:hypothetical protein Bca4012_089858 [Brassica carinata]